MLLAVVLSRLFFHWLALISHRSHLSLKTLGAILKETEPAVL